MPAETATTHEASESATTHDTLLAALEETRSELAKARDELRGTVQSIAIDRALIEAGATNLAAARTKLGDASGAEPAAAVAALKAKEPALFAPRARVSPGLSTSTPRQSDNASHTQARAAATRAAIGDRRALLDYMRLRRAAG